MPNWKTLSVKFSMRPMQVYSAVDTYTFNKISFDNDLFLLVWYFVDASAVIIFLILDFKILKLLTDNTRVPSMITR
jgi:hypothetical protein